MSLAVAERFISGSSLAVVAAVFDDDLGVVDAELFSAAAVAELDAFARGFIAIRVKRHALTRALAMDCMSGRVRTDGGCPTSRSLYIAAKGVC